MQRFPYAHATHPQWQMAGALVLAQLRAQMALPGHANAPTLGLLYLTDHYTDAAQDVLDYLSAELPLVTDWSGTVGVGIAATNVEYWDEPAMAVMLLELPVDQYRVFSGVAPLGLGFEAHTALVHADGATPDLGELVAEMAARTGSGYVFGGLSSGRARNVQFAVGGNGNMRGHGAAGGVFSGGLSGVAFGEGVHVVSRVTQGCAPISKARTVTAADRNVVQALDGAPALDWLVQDLALSLGPTREAMDALRATLVGIVRPADLEAADTVHSAVRRTGNFGDDVVVRHILGLDAASRGIAVADYVEVGSQLVFCQRNVQAAKADLARICAEVREELEPEGLLHDVPHSAGALPGGAAAEIAGAIYVSCTGRGGAHFGADHAELQWVRRVLGDVPLVGFFANGEIAHHHIYGYTGVLTVFYAAGTNLL